MKHIVKIREDVHESRYVRRASYYFTRWEKSKKIITYQEFVLYQRYNKQSSIVYCAFSWKRHVARVYIDIRQDMCKIK